jgi:hypothetical protein
VCFWRSCRFGPPFPDSNPTRTAAHRSFERHLAGIAGRFLARTASMGGLVARRPAQRRSRNLCISEGAPPRSRLHVELGAAARRERWSTWSPGTRRIGKTGVWNFTRNLSGKAPQKHIVCGPPTASMSQPEHLATVAPSSAVRVKTRAEQRRQTCSASVQVATGSAGATFRSVSNVPILALPPAEAGEERR